MAQPASGLPVVASRAIAHAPALRRIRMLSHLLDHSIPLPFTRFRIGIDPILGILPGGGDLLSLGISSYIVLEAIRLRLPQGTLIKMVVNLLTDTVLGSVPVAGNVFDVFWKANLRNLTLLEAHIAEPEPTRPPNLLFLILMAIAVIGIFVGAVMLVALVLQWIGTLFISPAVG